MQLAWCNSKSHLTQSNSVNKIKTGVWEKRTVTSTVRKQTVFVWSKFFTHPILESESHRLGRNKADGHKVNAGKNCGYAVEKTPLASSKNGVL
jgi:hypothetical protein